MKISEKQKFNVKYILPFIAIVLTLVVVSQFYMTTLEKNDLVAVNGEVTSILQDKYRHHKYTDDRITIKLHRSIEPFYFFDNRSNYFSTIMSDIHIGDTITIWHRTKLQARLGTGSEYKIMKIQKDTTTLYGFDTAKETFSGTGSFTTYIAIGMWLLYFFLRRQIKNKEGST